MIRALLRKEWRQHRWKIPLGLVVFPPTYVALLMERGLPGSLVWAGLLTAAFGVLTAMDAVAAERAEGSWEFLRSRPIPQRAIILTRLLWAFGSVVLVAVLSLAAASIVLQIGRAGPFARLDRIFWIRPNGLPHLDVFLGYALLPALIGAGTGVIASAFARSEGDALLSGLAGLLIGGAVVWIIGTLLEIFLDVFSVSVLGDLVFAPPAVWETLLVGSVVILAAMALRFRLRPE